MKLIARHDGADIPVEVERYGSGYRVRLDDRWLVVDLVEAGRYIRSLRFEDGTQFSVVHHRDGNEHEVSLAGSTFHLELIDPLSLKRKRLEEESGGGGVVTAPMPGRVVRLLAEKGDSVRKGAGLLILEAMKMENEIQSPSDGIVEEVLVSAGQTVDSGADLMRIG